MHLLMIGTSHRDAPVAIRECLAFAPAALADALAAMRASSAIVEGAILSTCNRTELYAVVDERLAGQRALEALWFGRAGVDADRMAGYVKAIEGREVVAHLLRVAAGLDSQLVGESQIQGQIKAAHASARAAGSLGTLLDAVFRHALVAGKRARTETPIARCGQSFARASYALAQTLLGGSRACAVLVLGTGSMGSLAAKQLLKGGPADLVLINRTPASAEELAAKLGAGVAPFEQLGETLARVDLAICCTAAARYVLTAEAFAPIVARRAAANRGPLVLVDLAVPRNLDPAIGDLPGIRLFDIDDLLGASNPLAPDRDAAVAAVEAILAQELAAYEDWLKNYRMAPTFRALKHHAEALRDEALERLWQQHGGGFDADQRMWVAAMARSLVNKFTHLPLTRLRGMSVAEQQRHAASVRVLFDLDAPAGLPAAGASPHGAADELAIRRHAPGRSASVVGQGEGPARGRLNRPVCRGDAPVEASGSRDLRLGPAELRYTGVLTASGHDVAKRGET